MMKAQVRSKTVELSQSLLLVFIAFAIEALLLNKILSHPAGGGSQVATSLLGKFLAVASVPYFVFFAIYMVVSKHTRKPHPQLYLLTLSLLGVMFCLLALRQYGHSTPGFLMVGYACQWLVILRYGYLCYRRN